MSLRKQALEAAASAEMTAREKVRREQETRTQKEREILSAFFRLPVVIDFTVDLTVYDRAYRDYGGQVSIARIQPVVMWSVDDLKVTYRYSSVDNTVSGYCPRPLLYCPQCDAAFDGKGISTPTGPYCATTPVGRTRDRLGRLILTDEEYPDILVQNVAEALRTSPTLCPACTLNNEAAHCPTCKRSW